MSENALRQPTWRQTYFNASTIPYWGVHVTAVIGVAVLGWSWSGLGLAVALYYARMFFVTSAYHRYFAHRTFKTSRAFQFVLAVCAQTTLQKGVLWWAAHHRVHHRESDQPGDVHSPVQRGFWWSHMGWILASDHKATRFELIRDFAKYPELRWLNRLDVVPGIALAVVLFFVGGAHALIWGFFVSTTLLWHGTFTINSLAHVWGRRRYDTTDDSRNNAVLALVTLGEGWHNNHHHYQSSCKQGFRWWEIDLSYYLLRGFQTIGLVRDIRVAPDYIVENRPKTRKLVVVADGPSVRPAPAVALPADGDCSIDRAA